MENNFHKYKSKILKDFEKIRKNIGFEIYKLNSILFLNQKITLIRANDEDLRREETDEEIKRKMNWSGQVFDEESDEEPVYYNIVEDFLSELDSWNTTIGKLIMVKDGYLTRDQIVETITAE